MTTPPSALRCPNRKCDATRDDLRIVFVMESLFHVRGESPGELAVELGHHAEPPGGHQPTLLCLGCNTRWPLPKGMTVRAMANGETTTIWDGRRH